MVGCSGWVGWHSKSQQFTSKGAVGMGGGVMGLGGEVGYRSKRMRGYAEVSCACVVCDFLWSLLSEFAL